MGGGKPRQPRLPEWIDHLGMAVWVTGPERRILYLNPRAEALLGSTAAECLGRPCYDVVQGRNEAGTLTCGPRCLLMTRAERGQDLDPASVSVSGPRGRRRWVELIVIPLEGAGEGPLLVHCALAADRTRRMETYLSRVASRTPSAPGSRTRPLTPREREIIELLAEDRSLHWIADKLHVSYVTVRNHVQHILEKLGTHSIPQAVARFLVTDSWKRKTTR